MTIGRPRKYEVLTVKCERCADWFDFKHYPQNPIRRWCENCYRFCPKKNTKLTDESAVVADYIGGMTLHEIGNKYDCNWAVAHQFLKRRGVKMRPSCPKEFTVCKIPDCDKPVAKVNHPEFGPYGRMCAEHRKAHYRRLNRSLTRKKRGVTPDRYESYRLKEPENAEYFEIQRAKKLMNEVKQWLKKNQVHPEASD